MKRKNPVATKTERMQQAGANFHSKIQGILHAAENGKKTRTELGDYMVSSLAELMQFAKTMQSGMFKKASAQPERKIPEPRIFELGR